MEGVKVGITGTGSLIGQAIIKSIKNSSLRDKIDITGFDYFQNTIGSYWCNNNYLLPDLLKPGIFQEWKSRIIDIIKKEGIEILFIGVDFELPFFAENRKEIEQNTGCHILVSDKRTIDIADDKYLTYCFLKENGLYYPETFLPGEIESEEIVFPCIIKPRIGARSRDVSIVESMLELKEKIKKVQNPVIQELIGTAQEEYTCGVIFFEDRPKEIIALNRSLKEGNTFKSVFSLSFPKIIYEYLHAVADKLRPHGACNFQLRLDNKGIPKIFEINARHSGTTYMRSIFGFNEVEYIIKYLKKDPVSPFILREGMAVRYYDEFFVQHNHLS